MNVSADRETMELNHSLMFYNLSKIYLNFPDGLKDFKQIPNAHHLLFEMDKNETTLTFGLGIEDEFADSGYRRVLRLPNVFLDPMDTEGKEWMTRLGEIEFYNLDFDFKKATIKGKDAFEFSGDVNINKMKTLITEILFEASGNEIYVHDASAKFLATSNETHGDETLQIKLVVQGLTERVTIGGEEFWLFNLSKFCEVFDADPSEVVIILPDYIEDVSPLGTTWENGTEIDYIKGDVDLLSDTDGVYYSVDSGALEQYLEIQEKIEELKATLLELLEAVAAAELAGETELTFQNMTKTLVEWREIIEQSEKDLDTAEDYLYSNDPENAALFYNKARESALEIGLEVPDKLDLGADDAGLPWMLILAGLAGLLVVAGIASTASGRKKHKKIKSRYDDDLYDRIKIDQERR